MSSAIWSYAMPVTWFLPETNLLAAQPKLISKTIHQTDLYTFYRHDIIYLWMIRCFYLILTQKISLLMKKLKKMNIYIYWRNKMANKDNLRVYINLYPSSIQFIIWLSTLLPSSILIKFIIYFSFLFPTTASFIVFLIILMSSMSNLL